MTTRAEIEVWFDRGVAKSATHMLIICDTFDWSDFPVYVTAEQNSREVAKGYSGDGYKIMECYSLSMDKKKQMMEHRAFNYD